MSTPPRLSPPRPKASQLADFRDAAKVAGIKPMDWQTHVAEVMTATRGKKWLYPEVCLVVARQNGKSTILIPRIVQGLLAGERIMHTAQNRELPREIFRQIADVMVGKKMRSSLKGTPRMANGQEVIRTKAGGVYRIVAPTTAGARGSSNDLLIIDEVRELDTFHFIAAARPTLAASENPQTIYMSNAGDDTSVVLNALRLRAGSDLSLAYMEWSAAPERAVDDREGWAEANPALGTTVQPSTLEDLYRGLPPEVFETEHLCRWVQSMAPRVVSDIDWQRSAGQVGPLSDTKMGIAVDGDRASAVLAWAQRDGTIAVSILADVHGKPLDLDGLGGLLKERARELKVSGIAHDGATDRDLARFLTASKALTAQEWAAASERFARTVESGQLRHQDADAVGADLAFTGRKAQGEAWIAVKAQASRPVTASLAAVRAVWLATAPVVRPKMY